MIFTVHIKPEALGDTRQVTAVAVPENTAKWALVFPPLWLAWHALVFELAIYAMIGVAVIVLLFTPFVWVALAVAGLPSLYLFLEGNQLRRNSLERAGYQMVDLIDAPDEEVALAKYFDSEPTPAESVPVAPKRNIVRSDDDFSFGLFADSDV